MPEPHTEIDRVGRQVAHAYRAGLADARSQVMGWADEQMQALPESRTPVAHGKAELLTDLRGFIAVRAEQTDARSTRSGNVAASPMGDPTDDLTRRVADCLGDHLPEFGFEPYCYPSGENKSVQMVAVGEVHLSDAHGRSWVLAVRNYRPGEPT